MAAPLGVITTYTSPQVIRHSPPYVTTTGVSIPAQGQAYTLGYTSSTPMVQYDGISAVAAAGTCGARLTAAYSAPAVPSSAGYDNAAFAVGAGATTTAPAPAGAVLAFGAPATGRPAPPRVLMDGIPDPTSIEQQKSQYTRSLDVQLDQGTKMLEQQNEVLKRAMREAAEQQKQQYNVQIDQQLRAQQVSVEQQASYLFMSLQQAAHEQKVLVEQRANSAILEFEQMWAHDERARLQYERQKKAYEKQILRSHSRLRGYDPAVLEMDMAREMQKQRQAYTVQVRTMQEPCAMQGAALQREAAAVQAIAQPQGFSGFLGRPWL